MYEETLRQHAAALKAIAGELERLAGLGQPASPDAQNRPVGSAAIPRPSAPLARPLVVAPPALSPDKLPQVRMAAIAAGAIGAARVPLVLRLHPSVADRLVAVLTSVRSRERGEWYAAALVRQLERLERTDPGQRPPFLDYTDPRPYVTRMVRLPAEVHVRFQASAQRHGLTLQGLGCSALERELERATPATEDLPF